MTRYEDTVEPEIAPCPDCGVLVDELDVVRVGGDRLCDDCAQAQIACTGQVPDA